MKVSGLLSNHLEEYKFDDKLDSIGVEAEVALESKLNMFKVEKLDDFQNKNIKHKPDHKFSSFRLKNAMGKPLITNGINLYLLAHCTLLHFKYFCILLTLKHLAKNSIIIL
jgi:hypothetical protein